MTMNFEPKTILIVVRGGGLKKENGVWRTTYFDEGDAFGFLGDHLRVVAAADMYKDKIKKGEAVSILAAGGIGRSKDPDHPTVSSVLKKELTVLGVPDDSIVTEEKSGSTFQQLEAVAEYISNFNDADIILISSRFHLPRIEAMICYAKQMSVLLDRIQTKNLSLVSAEDFLLKNNPEQWEHVIEEAYNSEFMKKRISLEQQGVSQIKLG